MTITDERKQQIDFSDVYYLAGQTLLVKKDSPITKIQDLDKADKTVCSATGSTSEQNLTKFAPNAQKVLFAGYAECVTALQQGRADAVSTDDIILAGFAAQDPDAEAGGRAVHHGAVRPGDQQEQHRLPGVRQQRAAHDEDQRALEGDLQPVAGHDRPRPRAAQVARPAPGP